MIPLGLAGSVQFTCREVDETALTSGGYTPLGAGKKERTHVCVYSYGCFVHKCYHIPASPVLPSLHSLKVPPASVYDSTWY